MKERIQRPEFFIALSKDVGTAVYLRKEASRYFDHLESELLHARKEIEDLRECINAAKQHGSDALISVENDTDGPGCCQGIADMLAALEGWEGESHGSIKFRSLVKAWCELSMESLKSYAGDQSEYDGMYQAAEDLLERVNGTMPWPDLVIEKVERENEGDK